MNPAQQEAHKKIHELMVEHFDAGVCVVSIESHDGEQAIDSMKVTHTGGFAMAIGLCEVAKNWLIYKTTE